MRAGFILRTAARACLAAATVLLACRAARAGGGPENVFLIVNSASWASLAISNEYVRLRQIPPSNVFYLDWDGGFEQIEVEEFRERILGPTLKAIDDRGLGDQIDYVVYSSDFPFTIRALADLQGQPVPPLLSPACSINSLTYFWQLTMLRSPNVVGLRNNHYMRAASGRSVADEVHGFRAWYGWGADGELLEAGGQRYLLSTMLAMTSGRGNSVNEALAYLRRSAAADGTQPAGTVYYMQNENVRSTTRSGTFAAAVAELEKLGVAAVVENGSLPAGHRDVIGAMIGVSDFIWPKSGSTISPGALCEHLTSFGGMLSEGHGQTPLTELLRYGAAGASGTVVEPYAMQDKFPVPAIHVYYAHGCTLAEAFYQSVFGPFQLLIVGDPLCRPWANIPQVDTGDLQPDARLHGRIEILPGARFGRPKYGGDRHSQADVFELFVDGRRTARAGAGEPLVLDTAALGDGHHSLRVVAIAAGPIETQGRAILPVWIDNHGRSIEFSSLPAKTVRWDQKLLLRAKAPGMAGVAFLHDGRLLGKFVGEAGQVEINPRSFGSGPVTVRAVGLGRGGPTEHVFAQPIELDIQAAAPLSALKQNSSQLERGLLLTVRAGQVVPIQETFKPDWLAEAGVKPGDRYELDGYFDAPHREIYQFQLWHDGDLKLSVDGTQLYDAAQGNRLERFVPVALAAGLHRLQLSGRAGDLRLLRVLFGGPGSKSLDGRDFRHLAKR